RWPRELAARRASITRWQRQASPARTVGRRKSPSVRSSLPWPRNSAKRSCNAIISLPIGRPSNFSLRSRRPISCVSRLRRLQPPESALRPQRAASGIAGLRIRLAAEPALEGRIFVRRLAEIAVESPIVLAAQSEDLVEAGFALGREGKLDAPDEHPIH